MRRSDWKELRAGTSPSRGRQGNSPSSSDPHSPSRSLDAPSGSAPETLGSQRPVGPHPDIHLAQRVLGGENQAVDEFLERMLVVRRVLQAKNLRLGRRLDPSGLEDAIQDTLLAIWRRLDSYEGRGNLEAWAYHFAHRVLLSKTRLRRNGPELSLDATPSEPESEDGQVDPFLQESVYEALERLGPPGSHVLRAKHFEGLTFEEIAAREGEATSTVKSQYYRALKKLRGPLGSLAAEFEEQGDQQ